MSDFHHLFHCFCVKQSDCTKIYEAEMPPRGDVENYYLVTQVQHMSVESLRYFGISKQVYLLGFVTRNESALFDLFNLSVPCLVNSYLIPWLT